MSWESSGKKLKGLLKPLYMMIAIFEAVKNGAVLKIQSRIEKIVFQETMKNKIERNKGV